MWHPISRIAENHRWDSEKTDEFVKFAESREEQYSLDVRGNQEPYVSTFFVDKLVEDFQNWEVQQAELRDEAREERRGRQY